MWCPRATQCQTIRDDFESASIEDVDAFQVHVDDKSVGPHSRPCFFAHLRCCLLKWKHSSLNDPCHTARCSMMAKRVELAATSAGA